MQIEITKSEAHKILDAIKAYSNDYVVTGAVSKTFDNITIKMKSIINS